jgi:cytochrome b561
MPQKPTRMVITKSAPRRIRLPAPASLNEAPMSSIISRDRPQPLDLRQRKERDTYDPVARSLHWLVFIVLAVQVLVGWSLPHIRKGMPQEGIIDWHLSIGAALMFLVVLRLLWRLVHPTPPAASLAPWERKISGITHTLLYALLLVIPVLGWAAANYFGFTVHLFGIFSLPAIADGTMEWAHEAGDLHEGLVNILLYVVGLHVLAALWHHFIRRDRVLQRMLPWLR